MNRLTEKNDNKIYTLKEMEWNPPLLVRSGCTIFDVLYRAIQKLGAYEDTGLMPDEIGKLNAETQEEARKMLEKVAKLSEKIEKAQERTRWIPVTEQITNRTYNNERRNLSAFFTWMRKSKIIQDNPVDNVDAKKVVMGKIDYYSREEIIELRDACKTKRDRAIIEVFRSTGARVGEIAEIRLDQVDMHTGDIPIIGEKGGRARTLYLDAEARYYLAAYLDERKDNSPYLFTQTVGAKRGRMGTATYRTIMRKIGKRAKIQSRVYPHKMRKTLGMDLKQHGLDIGIIQEILGHASPAVTSMYYAQSTTESLRSVRQRMSA